MEQSVEKCPLCGGTETAEFIQEKQAMLRPVLKTWSIGAPLYHRVCLNCGAVIRSYIKDPQYWAAELKPPKGSGPDTGAR